MVGFGASIVEIVVAAWEDATGTQPVPVPGAEAALGDADLAVHATIGGAWDGVVVLAGSLGLWRINGTEPELLASEIGTQVGREFLWLIPEPSEVASMVVGTATAPTQPAGYAVVWREVFAVGSERLVVTISQRGR